MSVNIHSHTPILTVVDGRGLQLREVRYLCNESIKTPEARITRYRHEINGQVVEQHAPYRDADLKTVASKQVSSLSGALLLNDNVDAGWRLIFFGEAGQTLEKWDSRGSHWQTEYDNQLRPQVIYEKSDQSPRKAIERFTYAASSTDFGKTNQCGRLIRHDDPAGTLLFSEYDLAGKLLSQTRHMLKDQQAANWPKELDKRKDLLDSDSGHTTTWRYAPTGETLEQKDAKGHTQRFWFDVAGQLKKVTLQLSGATEQRLILDQVRYNALGQIESQVLGDKITSAAIYTPENGRMSQRTISRTGASVLQKLHYAYDAVGNVLNIEDHSKPEQHNANQRIKPVSTYVYDSLYQLVQASGREEQGASISNALPDWVSGPGDRSRLLNFTQRYTYDECANLIKLQHQREGNNYTREMRIAPDSNRGLSWKTADPEPDFATRFDANGNLQSLQTGQPLEWNARNQLQRVTLVERSEQEADTESYLYDGNGQRVSKRQTQKAHALLHRNDVTYLPGLEIRESTTEKLDVITVQAGRCSVRCLHWSLGTPSAITNGALRYSFDDHLGSNTMELDAEGSLISEEGYYPFGGTAWRAARNVLEAKYRTIRYSSKERDASGLYYYGQRYYAPWLLRWINPDPAGTADGLNLYCMVGNNPVRFVDHQGLGKDDIVTDFAAKGRARSQQIMSSASQVYPGTTPAKRESFRKKNIGTNPDYKFTNGLLKDHLVAHSYAVNTVHGQTFVDFFNIAAPKKGPTDYKGVDAGYEGSATSTEFYLNFGSYKINDAAEYLTDLSTRYSAAKDDPLHKRSFTDAELIAEPTLSRTISQSHELQPDTRDLIAAHIKDSDGIIPIRAGGPGAHSEVRLFNSVVALYPNSAERLLTDLHLFTDTLMRGSEPEAFPACHNCSGIIPEGINIPTGRSIRDYQSFNAHVLSIRSAEH